MNYPWPNGSSSKTVTIQELLNMIHTKQMGYPGRILKFLFYQSPDAYLECVLEMDWPHIFRST